VITIAAHRPRVYLLSLVQLIIDWMTSRCVNGTVGCLSRVIAPRVYRTAKLRLILRWYNISLNVCPAETRGEVLPVPLEISLQLAQRDAFSWLLRPYHIRLCPMYLI
jgi:hypothetical protein